MIFSEMRKISILIAIVFISSFSVSGKKRIAWDGSSIMKVDDNIDYCRLKFLSDGNMAVVYRHLDGCKIKIYDSERICVLEKMVFSNKYLFNKDIGKRAYVLKANPEILELQTGRLLYVCNYRPLKEHVYPFSIASAYSDDHGITWSDPVVVYSADSLYENGCWEPALLELDNGIIQLYFSNENNFRSTDEQEICMIESYDKGRSWSSDIKRISYSMGKRDGMPVPKLYKDSIYVAIEDNTIGKHHPSIICTSQQGCWPFFIDEKSSNRISVMKNVFDKEDYGGAPYLAIDSEGTQYISFQSTYHRDTDISKSNILVAVREEGKIVDLSYPFIIPLDKYGRWGAIELKNDQEIWCTVSSNIDGICVPYIIRGYILNDCQQLPKRQKRDAYQMFLGHHSDLSVWSALSYHKGNICIQSKLSRDLKHGESIEYYLFVPDATSKSSSTIKFLHKRDTLSVFKKIRDYWMAIPVPVKLSRNGSVVNYRFPCEINGSLKFTMNVFSDKVNEQLAGTDIVDVNTWFEYKIK